MKVRIEKQEDGSYIAYNTDSEKYSIIGTGESVTEARQDFFNSVEEMREIADDAYFDAEPMFHFDLSSLFEYYKFINVSAFARMIGINATLMRQYKRGDTYISETQMGRIEDGLHRVGKELTELRLL